MVLVHLHLGSLVEMEAEVLVVQAVVHLGGMAATLGFSMVLADWMILEISCLGAIGAAAGACLVGTCGPGMAASLIWIQFLLKTPLGVLTTYELGVSAFWRTFPGMDHFLVEGSCSLSNCFGRSLGSSLV